MKNANIEQLGDIYKYYARLKPRSSEIYDRQLQVCQQSGAITPRNQGRLATILLERM